MKIAALSMRALVLASLARAAAGSKEFDELVEEEVRKHKPEQQQRQEMKEEVFAMGRPDLFAADTKNVVPCHENGAVASWCDVNLDRANLECVMLPEFDLYGCSCVGEASLCPTECVNGVKPDKRDRYGISCRGIPEDEPNYILKEMRESRPVNHCENNAVVAGWCDDYVNRHLECELRAGEDEYSCRCHGRLSACPDDCVGGADPIRREPGLIRCKGVPVDQPNYVLKEARK